MGFSPPYTIFYQYKTILIWTLYVDDTIMRWQPMGEGCQTPIPPSRRGVSKYSSTLLFTIPFFPLLNHRLSDIQ